MKVHAITDVGLVRKSNQDYCFYTTDQVGRLPNLFLVADGMGGHKAGDLASRFTVDEFQNLVSASEYEDTVSILTEAVVEVNNRLLIKSGESPDYAGMGTTLVAATIEGSTLKVANVGDSRLYILKNDICQITRDHSLVEEMVLRGQLDKNEARTHVNKNIITRAIGAGDEVTPEVFSVDLDVGVKILICTDGLTNMVDDKKIEKIMKSSEDVRDITMQLLKAAKDAGGKDNITAMIIDPELER